MEMQFFVKPGTQEEWYNHWKEARKFGMLRLNGDETTGFTTT